ncbi:MAG: hypothetical protein ACTSRV_17315 [Candidatus Freyarchaeota archaeon]
MRELESLADIVGVENLVEDPGVLEEYSGDFSFVPRRKPLCVVYPSDGDTVRGIVGWGWSEIPRGHRSKP